MLILRGKDVGEEKKGKMPPNLPAHMFPYQAEPGLSLSAFSAAASFSIAYQEGHTAWGCTYTGGVLTTGRKRKSFGVIPCLSLEGLALYLVLIKDGVFSLLEAERSGRQDPQPLFRLLGYGDEAKASPALGWLHWKGFFDPPALNLPGNSSPPKCSAFASLCLLSP